MSAPEAARQRGDGARGFRNLARAAGGPIERQAGDDDAGLRDRHRLRERLRRGRRAEHGKRRLDAVVGERAGEVGRVLPHPADRVGGHQQAQRPAPDQPHRHAASAMKPSRASHDRASAVLRRAAGRVAVALDPRSSASQRASAATPVRHGIGDRSSSARVARLMSET